MVVLSLHIFERPAMKLTKIKSIKLPKIELNLKQKFFLLSISAITTLTVITYAGLSIKLSLDHYRDNYYLATHPMVDSESTNNEFVLKFRAPVTIETRETEELKVGTPVVLSARQSVSPFKRVISEQPNPTLAEYICEVFEEDCKLALAIARAESGMREDAMGFNTNNTMDYGVYQINTINWKLGGCDLKTIIDARANVRCAYRIWDRADGVEGDGKGKWNPWVAYTNGAFQKFYN